MCCSSHLSGALVVILGVGGLCGCIGKALLYVMLRMVSACRFMCSACCSGILWRFTCVGLGGWRSTG
jgi:hypothetical protein